MFFDVKITSLKAHRVNIKKSLTNVKVKHSEDIMGSRDDIFIILSGLQSGMLV